VTNQLPASPLRPAIPQVVVAAAILDGNRLLAAQRSEPPALAGGWELPGGKVDDGETDHDALLRECREELGVVIRIGRQVGGDWPLAPGLLLRVWLATLKRGTPAAIESHLAVRWLDPNHWYDVAWLAADLPVVDAVKILIAGQG
jgi:8-oxo-dGTP diphosphatase